MSEEYQRDGRAVNTVVPFNRPFNGKNYENSGQSADESLQARVDTLRPTGHVAAHRAQDGTAKPIGAVQLGAAGFAGHLLCVVPPGATLSPRSRLRPEDRGKAAGRRRGDVWTGDSQWRLSVDTPDCWPIWDRWGANVGVRCDRFPAVDIDIADPALEGLVDHLVDFVRGRIGPAPTRAGRLPKLLMSYRTLKPILSWQLAFAAPSGEPQLIELLGGGRYFVGAGVHPCGRVITWAADPAMPRHHGRAWARDLSLINEDMAISLRHGLAVELTRLGFKVLRDRVSRQRHADADVCQESLRGSTAELDLIERAMRSVPNDAEHFASRASYIRVLAALKAAFADEPARGKAVALEWAGRWPGSDEDVIERDWSTLGERFTIGVDWLLNLLRQHGFEAEVGALVASAFDDLPDEADAAEAVR